MSDVLLMLVLQLRHFRQVLSFCFAADNTVLSPKHIRNGGYSCILISSIHCSLLNCQMFCGPEAFVQNKKRLSVKAVAVANVLIIYIILSSYIYRFSSAVV